MKKFLLLIGFIFFSFAANLVHAAGSCDNVAYLDSLGGSSKSAPTIQQYNGRLVVAVRGMDNGVWVREWNNNALTGWYQVNGGTASGNLRFATEGNSLFLYVQGADGFVYKAQYQSQQQWSAWQATGQANSDFGAAGSDISGNYKVYTIGAANVVKIGKCAAAAPPEWTKNLVIYEIATKEFTSPNGPETGNFQGIKDKIPYLADLGVTGIWLTGSSLSDPHHFYNIWTQYACIKPDALDPTLGTEQDFRDMINEAHQHNIKIFLDVITHGVMNDSPLISEHPSWFSGGSWRMTDYDWSNGNGDQKGLEDWWVNMWTNYVVNYGIDGYRLDLGSTRVDLWSRIRDNAAGAGHPIIIMPESYNETGFKNSVYDLWQYDISLPDNMALLGPTHKITVYYGDGSSSSAYISNTDLSKSATGLSAVYRGIDADKVGTISKNPDGILDNHATIYGLDASKTISNVVIDSGNGKWALNPNGNWYLSMERNNTSAEVYFSPFPDEPEVQAGSRKYYIEYLSNHDFGDYQLKGSRFKAGYSLLFAPTIPLFMSGEEFNNPYTPVPNKSNCLYGAVSTADGGCGGWLYASQLQWQNLQTSPNKEFYNDFKKIVALRKNEPALNYFAGSLGAANLITVGDFNSNIAAPVPYIRWVNGSAILVAGNGNTASAAQMALDLSKYLAPVGLDGKAYYNIEDLWSGTGQNYSKNDLANFNFQIAPDNFRIFKIIQTNSVCAAGQIVGCQVCNPDGLGWQDDNSKCPGGEICSAGTCVAAGSGGGGSSGGGGGGSAATTTTTTTVAKTGNPSTGSGSSSRSGGSSSSSKPVAKMTRAEILAAIAKIQALIADLQKQLAAMGGGTAAFSCIQITKNLFYGMVNDPQIKCLQEVLKSQGYAVIASGNYDAATKAAVALFQQKYAGEILAPYHLTRGSGNVGNATRMEINQIIK